LKSNTVYKIEGKKKKKNETQELKKKVQELGMEAVCQLRNE
jgi:hypothetical protein